MHFRMLLSDCTGNKLEICQHFHVCFYCAAKATATKSSSFLGTCTTSHGSMDYTDMIYHLLADSKSITMRFILGTDYQDLAKTVDDQGSIWPTISCPNIRWPNPHLTKKAFDTYRFGLNGVDQTPSWPRECLVIIVMDITELAKNPFDQEFSCS